MDQRITRFLKHHHVLTLSTISELGTWTAHCFYAFIPENQALVFTTDHETRHGREMLQNPNISGGIMLETKVIGKIRGIQLTGRALPLSTCHSREGGDLEGFVTPAKAGAPSLRERSSAGASEGRTAYLKRFPFALAVKLDLWILYIDYIKMTDNRLGFGKKLEWRREAVKDVRTLRTCRT